MASIMERIAEAERQADAILEEANRTARESVTRVKTEAEEAIAAADEQGRARVAAALVLARKEGEGVADGVARKAKEETDAMLSAAEKNVSEAVSYLMERIEATV
jgi:vacuolar-type H+-ATPase subunit H